MAEGTADDPPVIAEGTANEPPVMAEVQLMIHQ